jgi:hypothetical protein
VKEKPSKNSNQWQTLASRGGGGAGGVGDFGSLAGVAQINQGGTGQTTRAAGLNALLPSQTGNVQYMLLTDGAGTVSWGAQPVAGLPSQTSNSGKLLTTDGTNASWSGAVTVSGSNATMAGTVFFSSSADVQASRAAAGVLDVRHPSNTTSRIDVTGATSAGLGLRQSGVRDWFVTAQSSELRTSCLTANSIASYESGVLVRVRDTTASTSTSSGALVVSGGVGVAGAINCGSGLVANPLFTQTRKLEAQIPHTVSTEDYLRIGSNTGSTNTYAGEFGYGLTAGGSPQIRFNRVHAGTVTTWLTVPTSTGDAEFAGSVKTAAPSGGTAAAWKLGTVATVSPTSPNRTIEVDIGGTIYYIHAKTTNN